MLLFLDFTVPGQDDKVGAPNVRFLLYVVHLAWVYVKKSRDGRGRYGIIALTSQQNRGRKFPTRTENAGIIAPNVLNSPNINQARQRDRWSRFDFWADMISSIDFKKSPFATEGFIS